MTTFLHSFSSRLLLIFFCTVLYSIPVFSQSCPEQGTLIFPALSGQELLEALVSAYKPASTPSYDRSREIMYSEVDNQNGYVYGVYTGYRAELDPDADNIRQDAAEVNITAEHTWPQSKGATGHAKSDMNHLFPALANANGQRGISPYTEIPDNETDNWYRYEEVVSSPIADSIDQYSERRNSHPDSRYDSSWEPREDFKGDLARGMFYFYTMYKAQSDTEDPYFFDVQKDYFRTWNSIDTVSQREYERACMIAPYQDNKVNPFVIDPTLVERAYFDGSVNETTVQFSTAFRTVSETDGLISVELSIFSANADTATSVDVSYVSGTAEPGVDFEVFDKTTVTFPAGSSAPQMVSLNMLDDEEEESAETITLVLSKLTGPQNLVFGANDTLEISIKDDDGTGPVASGIWINEFHYDNDGADEGEFIELAVLSEFSDLSGVTVTLYNGSSSVLAPYDSFSGSDFVKGDEDETVTFYSVDATGLQNGGPDGISLDINGELVQFISYEGSFTATSGPAEGTESMDVGVSESGSNPLGSSISLSGTGSSYSDFEWAFTETATAGVVNDGQEFEQQTSSGEVMKPEIIGLQQNYPNPFNPQTTISYSLREPGLVTLTVYSVTGRKVVTLVDGLKSAGNHSILFDAGNLASGVYFYQLKAGNEQLTGRMLLSK